MTNAELIKALRYCCEASGGTGCSECTVKNTTDCVGKLMRDAADALEADERLLDQNTKRCEALRKQLRGSNENYEKHLNELEAQMPKCEIVPCDECKYRALASIGICWNKKLACVAGKRKERR